MRRRAIAVVATLALAACGGSQITAGEAVDEFTAAGLRAPNPRDITDTTCPELGCEEAVATDVVTVFRWADPAQAAAHSGGLKQPAYSLNEFVIAFPPDSQVDTAAYANALTEAVAERSHP